MPSAGASSRSGACQAKRPELARLCAELGALPEAPSTPGLEQRVATLRQSLLTWVDRLGPEVRPGADPEQFLILAVSVLVFWFSPTPISRALRAGNNDTSPSTVECHKKAVCDLLLHGLVRTDGLNVATPRG